MVQGVLVCGTFLTKRALMVIASLVLLVLILGGISLGIGLAMYCGFPNNGGYYYYDSCSNTKLSLLINGGVLIGFTVIGLIVIVVLSCRVKEASVTVQSTVVTRPYTVMPVYGQAAPVYPGNGIYPSAVPGQPQQFQPHVTASTSTGNNQPQPQYQQTSMFLPPKTNPEAAMTQPPMTDPEGATCSAQFPSP